MQKIPQLWVNCSTFFSFQLPPFKRWELDAVEDYIQEVARRLAHNDRMGKSADKKVVEKKLHSAGLSPEDLTEEESEMFVLEHDMAKVSTESTVEVIRP